uniref:hypothetical protein n=1 Tax=Roseovarius sp. BRH_c41 TaxID=1629709 RepID=UPI000A767223
MALITTNLKAQFETTNTVVSPTLWVDEVAGIELVQEHLMTAPVLRTGEEGTPTGASYFQFVGSIDGLGNDTLYDHDLPDGAEPRTMYIVARYPNQVNAGNFNGVMYGNPSTRQAFGMVMSGTEKVLTDFWAASYASVDSFNDDLWHVLAVTFDGEDVEGFIDNVNLMGGTPATLNTVLERLYINYKLSNNSGAFMDCAAVLIYAGAHNPAQLAETNAYLRNKYIEEIPSGGGTVVSERAASSGGTSGLNAAPVSVLSRTASNGGTSGATAAPVIVQGRAATSGGTSGADAAATLVSGRAGASGGTSGASASPVRIATRSAPGGG